MRRSACARCWRSRAQPSFSRRRSDADPAEDGSGSPGPPVEKVEVVVVVLDRADARRGPDGGPARRVREGHVEGLGSLGSAQAKDLTKCKRLVGADRNGEALAAGRAGWRTGREGQRPGGDHVVDAPIRRGELAGGGIADDGRGGGVVW